MSSIPSFSVEKPIIQNQRKKANVKYVWIPFDVYPLNKQYQMYNHRKDNSESDIQCNVGLPCIIESFMVLYGASVQVACFL